MDLGVRYLGTLWRQNPEFGLTYLPPVYDATNSTVT